MTQLKNSVQVDWESKDVIRPRISPREHQLGPPVLTTDGDDRMLMHLKAALI